MGNSSRASIFANKDDKYSRFAKQVVLDWIHNNNVDILLIGPAQWKPQYEYILLLGYFMYSKNQALG